MLVKREELAALHEYLAVHNYRVGAAAMRAINQVCDGVVDRLPLRPHNVEDGHVGLLAHFDRSKILIPKHAARPIDGQHFDSGFWSQHFGVEACFMKASDHQERLAADIEVV